MAIAENPRATWLMVELKYGLWNGDTAPTEYVGPINFTKAEVTTAKQEQDRLLSNMEGSYGDVIASVNKTTEPGKLSVEFNTMTPSLRALLLGADLSELTQSSSAKLKQKITLVKDTWIPLTNAHIAPPDSTASPAIIFDVYTYEETDEVLDVDGVTVITPYSLDKDESVDSSNYKVDYISGMIMWTGSGAPPEVAVDYSLAARTGEIYKAGKQKSLYVHLVGTGTDRATNKRVAINIWKANLAPTGAVDLAKGEYFTGAAEGDMITPEGKDSPWQYEYLSNLDAA